MDILPIGSTLRYAVKFKGLTTDVLDENVTFTAKFFTKLTPYDDDFVSISANVDREASGEADTIIIYASSSTLHEGILYAQVEVTDYDYNECIGANLNVKLVEKI